jgi:chitodextrinase
VSRGTPSRRFFDGIVVLTAALIMSVAPLPLLGSSRALATSFLFSDNFEGGNMSAWTSSSGLLDQQVIVRDGSWAARGTSTGQKAFAYKSLSSDQSDLYMRVFFQLVSHGSKVTLLRMTTPTNTPLVTLGINTSNKLYTIDHVTGVTTTSPTPQSVGAGVWHEVQLHALVSGTSSKIEVFADGVSDPKLNKTVDLGTDPAAGVQIGESSKGRTFDVIFDDAATDPAYINTIAPAPPTGLIATGVFADRVDLSWDPNMEADVAGYAIYRGDQQIATTDWAHTTFSDSTVLPLTGYSYTVETFDTAGRYSQPTDPLPVTTLALDGTPPSIPAGLTIGSVFSNQADLSWEASTDNQGVDGYTVYRDGSPIATLNGITTAYLDTSVVPSTTYSYAVDAFDPSGNHSAVSDPPVPAQTLDQNSPAVWWGVATHAEGALTDMQVLANLEQEIGRKFSVFRKYTNWDKRLPTAQQMRLWRQGYVPSTAWTTYVNGSGDLTFADVASGAYDSYITQQAESIKASGIHMFFTFQHEPEDGQGQGDPQAGPPADYIAAFEHVHDIFDQVGVTNLTWLNTLTLGAFKHANGKAAEDWTPPPQYFDQVGVDGYVRFPCVQWGDRPFLTFKQTFQEAYDFAQGLNKPLFIGEVGIIEQDSCDYAGDPNAKAQWVSEGIAQMRAWSGVAAICWSHVIVNFLDKHVLNYHVDSSPQALAAFLQGSNDPYFGRFWPP